MHLVYLPKSRTTHGSSPVDRRGGAPSTATTSGHHEAVPQYLAWHTASLEEEGRRIWKIASILAPGCLEHYVRGHSAKCSLAI